MDATSAGVSSPGGEREINLVCLCGYVTYVNPPSSGGLGAYPKSGLPLLELGLTAPEACVASRRRVFNP